MWEEVIEGGQLIWIHKTVGNVIRTVEGKFISVVPRVIKFGPFDSLEEAQKAAEDQEGIDRTLENYNFHLMNLTKVVRGQ